MRYLKLFENKSTEFFYKWLDENDLTFEIRGRRSPGEKLWYSADIVTSEIKDTKESDNLIGEYGRGDDPEEAIQDYIEIIKGKILVLNAYNKLNRKEYEIPEDFELWINAKKYNV